MVDTRHTIRGLRGRPDAVLFDWDNTLMDHDSYAAPVSSLLIQEMGTPPYPTPDELNLAWSADREECCERYFPGYSADEVRSRFHELAAELPVENATLLPGAREVIETLHAKSVPMAIVSNKPEATLKREVEHLGLSDYFLTLRGDRGDGLLKPDPAIVMQTLKDIGITHGNNWFVGDMMADIGAARSDGFQRFLIGHRNRKAADALSIGSDPAGKVIYLDSIALLKDFAETIPDRTPGVQR